QGADHEAIHLRLRAHPRGPEDRDQQRHERGRGAGAPQEERAAAREGQVDDQDRGRGRRARPDTLEQEPAAREDSMFGGVCADAGVGLRVGGLGRAMRYRTADGSRDAHEWRAVPDSIKVSFAPRAAEQAERRGTVAQGVREGGGARAAAAFAMTSRASGATSSSPSSGSSTKRAFSASLAGNGSLRTYSQRTSMRT